MREVIIEGGKPLIGEVVVSGSKNSVLKLISAAILSNQDVILENVPKIENVEVELEIIRSLGGKAEWIASNKLLINGANINALEIPFELGSKYRTASLDAAALLLRFGKASVPFPGGCKIGPRPINRWVDVWEALGIVVTNNDKYIYLDGTKLKGNNISFSKNTHMGTDIALLFSAIIPQETIINNAAEEPEIDDLIALLNLMGAKVERLEHRRIKVMGTKQFNGATFKVQPDRNEVVTYAVAALVTNGNITIQGIEKEHLLAFVNILTKINARFEINDNEMRVWRSNETLSPFNVSTAAYPGVMTDWQPLLVLLATQIEGLSTVYDTIYWDRFGYTRELNRMGTKIELATPTSMGFELEINDDTYELDVKGEPSTVAKIYGKTNLRGTKLQIPDLRAGATLVLAALLAEGKSHIIGFENVDRGYEDFILKLQALGGAIETLNR